ncbi:MAG: MCP four helix bundle domain-containing protein [Nitrospirae bacterium]|nr:MCP four helix bundle domain-containing protein [Nitrospirota bacterium]
MNKILSILVRLKLTIKLIMGFGFVLMTALMIGLQNQRDFTVLKDETQALYEKELLGISHIKEANNNLMIMGRSLRQMMLSPNFKEREYARRSLKDAQIHLQTELSEGRKRINHPENLKQLAEFDELFAKYCSYVEYVETLLESNNSYNKSLAVQFLFSSEFISIGQKADDTLDAITDFEVKRAKDAAAHVEFVYAKNRRRSIGLLLIGLIGASMFGWLIGISIRSPFNKLMDTINQLLSGNINIEIPFKDFDNEIGDIARSFEIFQGDAKSLERQNQFKGMQTDIGAELQRCKSHSDFGDTLFSRLAPIMGLVYAAFYVSNYSHTLLQKAGGYACINSKDTFVWGKGLVGQAAYDKRVISTKLTSDDNIGLEIGIGTLNIREVLIVPLLHLGEVSAVMELCSIYDFTDEQKAFLDLILPMVSMNFEILSTNIKTCQRFENNIVLTQDQGSNYIETYSI